MNMKRVLPVILIILTIGIGLGILKRQTSKGFLPSSINQQSESTPTGSVQPDASYTPPPPETNSPAAEGTTAPKTSLSLTINSPSDNSTVTNPKIFIRGKTAAGAEVFVNETETVADSGGNFSISITLEEGENPILIVVTDANGEVVEKEMNVNYDSGQ